MKRRIAFGVLAAFGVIIAMVLLGFGDQADRFVNFSVKFGVPLAALAIGVKSWFQKKKNAEPVPAATEITDVSPIHPYLLVAALVVAAFAWFAVRSVWIPVQPRPAGPASYFDINGMPMAAPTAKPKGEAVTEPAESVGSGMTRRCTRRDGSRCTEWKYETE